MKFKHDDNSQTTAFISQTQLSQTSLFNCNSSINLRWWWANCCYYLSAKASARSQRYCKNS